MKRIESLQNSVIKELKSLHNKKYRDETRSFFVEGSRLVNEVLESQFKLKKIVVSDKFYNNMQNADYINTFKDISCEKYIITDKLYKQLTDTTSPQGILVEAEQKFFEYSDSIFEGSFFLILEDVQDPGNMGTIIRTADAAGVNAIFVTEGCVDIYNPKVLRASMGSVLHLPIIELSDLSELLADCKMARIKIFATNLKAKKSCYEASYENKLALIIGNEANGVCESTLNMVDETIIIPMSGRAESLNAAAAASILIYEVFRQRIK